MEVGQEIAKNAERGAERLAALLAWVFLSDRMQKHDTDKISLTSVGEDVVKYHPIRLRRAVNRPIRRTCPARKNMNERVNPKIVS